MHPSIETDCVLFHGNRPTVFSSMETDRMCSLPWKQTDCVLFHGNRPSPRITASSLEYCEIYESNTNNLLLLSFLQKDKWMTANACCNLTTEGTVQAGEPLLSFRTTNCASACRIQLNVNISVQLLSYSLHNVYISKSHPLEGKLDFCNAKSPYEINLSRRSCFYLPSNI